MIKLTIIILGICLFLSVSTGGVLAWTLAGLFKDKIGGCSLLCGGFLIGLLTLDIIPSAWSAYYPFGLLLGGLLGFFFILVLHSMCNHSHTSSLYLLAVAMFIHTIPLSVTIGSLLDDPALSLTMTTSTILHHLPEGFALATVALSTGNKWGSLTLCFIGLSICFASFIWIGQQAPLSFKIQSILMGVSISLIGCTSMKEFIGQYIRTVPLPAFLTYFGVGYLFSGLFHLWL
ncbi:zinc transporter family protein [Sporosarcina soli]|uniref:zinc transporter family protein n=1 Tax=Sporosarcina soli TaxID=334736 RepID=UPI0036D289ED